MQNPEVQQMLLKIIEHAQTAESTEFHFLRNWAEYRFFISKRRSFKLLIKAVQNGADRLFKNYCKGIVTGESNFTKLLAYQQLLPVIAFYQHELQVIADMLDEYDAYLAKGNFLRSFLGDPRAEADLVDFRR